MNAAVVHWVSTAVIVCFLWASAASYVFSAATIEGVRALGFPDFFRWQLVALKIIASLVLLVPIFDGRFREWAYAGVALFLLTSIVAHVAHDDPWVLSLINAVLFALLLISNFTQPGLNHLAE